MESTSWFTQSLDTYYFSIQATFFRMKVSQPQYQIPTQRPLPDFILHVDRQLLGDRNSFVNHLPKVQNSESCQLTVLTPMSMQCAIFRRKISLCPLETVIGSFDYKISATIATTPQSAVLLVMVLIAVFSFILKIVEFILKIRERLAWNRQILNITLAFLCEMYMRY